MNDDDLEAVRQLRPYEPTDLAVARTRRRVLVGEYRSTSSARRRLAVAGSAAAILAITGLVIGIQANRSSTPPPGLTFGAAPTSDAVTPTPTESAAPTPAPTLWDMSITPAQVPDGAVLYIRSDNDTHEMWLDVNGAIVLQIAEDDAVTVPYAADDPAVAAQREALLAEGPSLVRPTPAYLATLPTDPATLLSLLSDQLARDGANRPRPDLLVKNTLDFVAKVEPLLSPAQRATLLEAIALAPNAEVDHSPRTFHGHDVYLAQQHEGANVAGFIVDTATGRIIGSFAGVGAFTETNNGGLITYAVVAHPGDRP